MTDKELFEIIKLLSGYVLSVGEVLTKFAEVVDDYLLPGTKYADLSLQLRGMECSADDSRRALQKIIARGHCFPVLREDFIILSDLIKQVAGKALLVSQKIAVEKPDIPPDYRGSLKSLTLKNIEIFEPVKKLIPVFLDDRAAAEILIDGIAHTEREADFLEWQLYRDIYASEKITPVHKILLRDLIEGIGDISDIVENISDKIIVMMIKRH